MICVRFAVVAATMVIGGGPFACWTLANDFGTPRGIFVDEVRNDHPAFLVRVNVNHPDRIYRQGEELRVEVVSAKAGYLYLVYCDAGGNVSCLFPNAFNRDNRIAAMQPITIPRPCEADGSSFRLRIGAPFGNEVLKAIVCVNPLDANALGMLLSNFGHRESLPHQAVNAAANDWAEHGVEITTCALRPESDIETPQDAPSREPSDHRRVGIFVGIRQFADQRIQSLATSDRDATVLADVMRRSCGVGQGWLLLNEQATRQNIERAIRRQATAATRPGDTVIIYWSGHGSRCADDGGDEQDGFDEFLVPYDGNLDSIQSLRNTMIMDDMFGRWVQELDGRRVLVILDTCHSGGQSSAQKSIVASTAAETRNSVPPPAFDFFDGEFSRIKDIGQREVALLASSTSDQLSFERADGDMSTMTYCLVEQLRRGDGPLSLEDGFDRLKMDVSRYVQTHFPGANQTPVLISTLSKTLYLRP